MTHGTTGNGMRVVLLPDDGPDVAAVYLWMNVGSVDEPPGMEGAAHFIEHLVFKGTDALGVGECAARIEAMGGDLNAWTGFDETVLHATVRGVHAADAVDVLAEMMRHATFDAAELERERDVVIEEIRGGDDDVGLVVGEAMYAEAWPNDPYGRSIIGTAASVRALPRDALLAFYRERYVPANACIAVAGRFDVGEVGARIRDRFAGGPHAPVRARPAHAPARGGGTRRLRRRFGTHLVRLAFPAVAFAHDEAPVYDVLTAALGGGSASPLVARLRATEGCFDAYLDFDAELRGGLLVMEAHVAAGAEDRVLGVAAEVLAGAAAGGIERAALVRARAGLAAERRFRRQTADGRAHEACFSREVFGEAGAWRDYDVRVAAVSDEAVHSLAGRVLRPEAALTVALTTRKVALTPRWVAPRAPAPDPAVQRHVLDNGVRVLVQPDRSSIGALRVVGLGGQLDERAGREGLATLWTRTVARGAGGLGPDAFGRAVSTLGGGVGASTGRSTQALRAEAPVEAFGPAFELALLPLLEPAFLDEELVRARAAMLDELATRDDEPAERLSVEVWAAACPGHPWGLDPAGTTEAVTALDRADLVAAHLRWARPENLVFGVAGDVDVEYLLGRIAAATRHLGQGPRPRPPRPLRAPARTRRVVLTSARDQAHLCVAWPGLAVDDPRGGVLDVLTELLGGQSGRLFLELREALGLAYAVGADSLEGVGGGRVTAALAADPERLDEAEAALLGSVGRVAAGQITDAEVERARAAVLGAGEAELQTAGARASESAYAELYGLDGTRYRALLRRAEGVDRAAVAALAAELFARPLVIGRLGPA